MGLNLIWSTIVWILIIGGISFLFRKKIAKIVRIIPLPRFLLFLIVGTFFAIIEENINCPPEGCSLIPITIPIFFIFLLVLLIIIKIFKIKNFYLASLIFGVIGWTAEFLLGSHKEVLWSSPAVTIVMSIWTVLTYSVIVIIPLTIILKE